MRYELAQRSIRCCTTTYRTMAAPRNGKMAFTITARSFPAFPSIGREASCIAFALWLLLFHPSCFPASCHQFFVSHRSCHFLPVQIPVLEHSPPARPVLILAFKHKAALTTRKYQELTQKTDKYKLEPSSEGHFPSSDHLSCFGPTHLYHNGIFILKNIAVGRHHLSTSVKDLPALPSSHYSSFRIFIFIRAQREE